MIEIRDVVAGLSCSALCVGVAVGQVSEEPQESFASSLDEVFDSTDLEVDFDTVHNPPLASDKVSGKARIETFGIQNGVYVVGYGLWVDIGDGEFDGDVAMTAPGNPDMLFVPDIDSDIGFGIGFGYRYQAFAVEFTYQRSEHDTDFLGSSLSDAIYHTFNIDTKWYFNTESPLQPHIFMGLVIPWLDANSSSVNMTTGAIGDTDYVGVGVNVGGGLTFYLTPQIAVIGQAGYRFAWMTSARGTTGPRASIDDNLEAFGFFAMAGVSVGF
ncbi:MAG: hypothetical protein ACYSU7_07505 [Planctomycetota bacterium]|jgi:hypothetical protein